MPRSRPRRRTPCARRSGWRRNILARIDGGRPLQPFRYQTIGTLASIGHRTGVGVVFGIRVRGWLAWFMWRGYYWSRVPGFNRKVRVAIDWGLTALFGADSVQLKVEDASSALGSTGRRRPPQRDGADREPLDSPAPCPVRNVAPTSA